MLSWVPRVVLYPAYLVTDFVVRRPLGALTRAVEGAGAGSSGGEIEDFSFGTGKRSGLVPTARLDTDFRPTVGVYFYYDRLGIKSNGIRAQATFGGTDWLGLTVGDRLALGPRSSIELRLDGERRPDRTFYGVGPRTLARDRSRYGDDSLDGILSFTSTLPRGLSARTHIDLAATTFRADTCCDSPSLPSLAAKGRFAIPYGFTRGTTALRTGEELVYDSRPPDAPATTGVRVGGSVDVGSDLRAPGASGWIRYGASARGFLNLFGQERVLSLEGTLRFADPLGGHEIPFNELIRLGGSGPMSGFHEDRLLGRSAAALTLEYRYPIWAFLGSSLQLSVGNVFDAHLADFAARDLRLAFAAGIHTVGTGTQSFNLLFGGGTETFAQGGSVRELRVSLGFTQGF
ncbi:MAG: BamA/TamA family outer membrane protein [Byssovorax sp.]